MIPMLQTSTEGNRALRQASALPAGAFGSIALLDRFQQQENAGEARKQLHESSVAPAGKLAGPFLALCAKHSSRNDEFKKGLKETASNMQCGQSDIQQFLDNFSLFLGLDDVHARAGLFISYMIMACTDEKIEISVKNSPGLDYLGYQISGKRLDVTGDVGDYFGHSSCYCQLIVSGNAGKAAGYHLGDSNFPMSTSRLRICGNAGQDAGLDLVSGVISIEGDATGIGRGSSKLSEFHVEGNIYTGENNLISFDSKKGAFVNCSYGSCNLFQRGVQLVKDGEVIAEPMNK